MKAKNGFYSIVQYVPLPLSNHAEIVGVVLLCSDPDFIGVLFAIEGLRMLAGILDRAGNNKVQNSVSPETDQELVAATTVFRNLSQLKEFLSGLGSEIQLTAAARVKVVNPLLDMTALLDKCITYRRVEASPDLSTAV
jgi:hypothetical protein